MRLVLSWLRDFVDVDASAEDIAATIGLRGFEVASIEQDINHNGDGDAVIDFEITANRPDCLSVVGLAREVATVYDLPMKTVGLATLDTAEGGGAPSSKAANVAESRQRAAVDGFSVTVDDVELCPRYAAAIGDVTVGPSPA